jgi:Protein of unknown function (DUF1592)/Protein of unknown function (DUF1588)/PA14 domain/Protein of unknown function (DUF1595)/Cytochrome C oxidase, cbb3-type, subunit III
MIRWLLIFWLLSYPLVATADGQTGEQFYRTACAKCHGDKGQGVKAEYDQPLVGKRSVPQLAKYIAKAMPPDNPGSISVADSESVAGYIHQAFYSQEAQERNKPPRLELARLTVNQYRQTMFDLVGAMQWNNQWGDKSGLKAEYYASRDFRKDKRVAERVDAGVKFDFGITAPVEKLDPIEFSILWTGAVLAPVTGNYEFVVQCDQALRLNVNGEKLIDAWVKSGDDKEFRGSLYLVGGRAYPLRLEFSKAKQGVQNDPNKDKPKPLKPAQIHLLWKPPGQVQEHIPARFLSPNAFPDSFACATPFPPDDRSYGWERGTTISKEWEQATTEAALETAAYILPRMNQWAGTKDDAPDRGVKLKTFAHKFAEKALRRPLTDAEKRIYVDRHFDDKKADLNAAMKRVILLVLKSPRFLYLETSITPEAYAIAARLAYTLWDAPPDTELLQAAKDGNLKTPEQIRHQAERMARDPKTQTKLLGFLHHWLGLDTAHDLAKNTKRFPGFDASAIQDLRTSLDLTLLDVLKSNEADFRKLFLEESIYFNPKLATLYNVPTPKTETFEKLPMNPKERLGVFTHPYILAHYAYTSESSPIHRGVFLARGILGVTLKPPNEAFTPLNADLHPKLTTRERTEMQTGSRACQACHGLINPLGFSLEKFDAIGRFRGEENGKPVNDLGFYLTRTGDTAKFAGGPELAKFLVASVEVQDFFAEQLFHHLAQQSIRAFGANQQTELRETFAKQQFNIRQLAAEIAIIAAKPKADRSQ